MELSASPPQGQREILKAPTLPSPASRGWEMWALPAREEGAELAPLVGARPLRPTALQRAAEPAPVAPVTESAERPALQPSTQRDAILVPLATQPRFSPTLPDPSVAVGRRLQVQTQWERSVSRAAELPLAPVQRAAAEPAPEHSVPDGESTPEVVQRRWLDSISSAIGTIPPSLAAFSHEPPGATAPGHDGGPGVPGQASGPMPPATKAMPQESDMDDLANKLYDRIRTRLKTELLVARERAGMLTDWR